MSVLQTLNTRRTNQPIDTDSLYYVLSSRRRRMTLQYLSDHNSSQPVTRRTLVSFLEEQGIGRQNANVSLYQTHLPVLAEHGLIDYNPDRGLLSITELGATVIILHTYVQYLLKDCE